MFAVWKTEKAWYTISFEHDIIENKKVIFMRSQASACSVLGMYASHPPLVTYTW